jgi:hypothetical protein
MRRRNTKSQGTGCTSEARKLGGLSLRRERSVCHTGITNNPMEKTKVLSAYRDMPLQFVTVYEHKD